jgi:hypothetical protein
MKTSITACIAATLLVVLGGCASTTPTVDDGRKLDRQLLVEMQAYGEAAAAIRPAIVRTATLNNTECSTQYELPFEVLSAYGLGDDAKVAWVRALGVDESLTVIAADPSSGLKGGDIVAQVAGYKSGNTRKMADALLAARDRGEPFTLELASGEQVTVSPIKICRGHVLVASPFEPASQGYHWAQSVHPLEIFHQQLTLDEAAWIVLWTQGLSERGGPQMKTYAFMVGSIKWITVLALGFGASGGGAAAAGTSTASHQLAGQAASLMAQAAANRASLSGISGVAASMFDRADQWAFDSMRKLGLDPRAGLSLHAKLVAQGAASNAFLFDERRLANMRALVAGLPKGTRGGSAVAATPRGRQR